MRTFDFDDQLWFARSTGDVNPMHVDPVGARRTQAGAPVVHGIHALLWALDQLVAAGAFPAGATQIFARFEKFVYLDRPVALRISRTSTELTRAEVQADSLTVLTVELRSGDIDVRWRPMEALPPVDLPAAPRELSFADVARCRGRLAPGDPLVAVRFPLAARRLGERRIAAIAQLSTLIGMVCPGKYSMFGDLALEVAADDERGIAYDVRSVDERFQSVEIAVAGGGIFGTANAFVRQPPVAPPSTAALTSLVAPGEFAGNTVLVVGGSRGLGAVTSRLLLAGGARVILTYARGEQEARAVAAAAGTAETARVARFDVLEPVPADVLARAEAIDHVYFFATPTIAHQSASIFSSARLDELLRYYVTAFAELCEALLRDRTKPLRIFYPSSVSVSARPRGMTEYAMAKAAGEVLCEDLQRYRRHAQIVIRRLPRILTDQTASIVPQDLIDGTSVMLPIVREMHGLAGKIS
jgi:NADP-dependent 3-hydroxy acid dehydrogenase YdfG